MSWHRGPMLAFDTETTGPDPNTARIVSATLVHINPDTNNDVQSWLVNPGIDIPAEATAVHGISTELARAVGVDPDAAIYPITGAIAIALHRGVPLVAFNAAYDLTVLDRECRRHNIPTLTDRLGDIRPVIDPHVLDKGVDRYRKGKRTLTATCEHYKVQLDGAHDATADAFGAARVAWVIGERFAGTVADGDTLLPVLPEDTGALHDVQVRWRAEQAASLQEYLRRKDPSVVVNGDWPVQALPETWEAAA